MFKATNHIMQFQNKFPVMFTETFTCLLPVMSTWRERLRAYCMLYLRDGNVYVSIACYVYVTGTFTCLLPVMSRWRERLRAYCLLCLRDRNVYVHIACYVYVTGTFTCLLPVMSRWPERLRAYCLLCLGDRNVYVPIASAQCHKNGGPEIWSRQAISFRKVK
jgi:DNA-binding IclR family transcriptional regulator